jgi:hypothetical protein
MREFVIQTEPAHDGTDLAGIADRLGRPMAPDAMRVWYERDVSALLQRVLRLEDARQQQLWQKAANRELRDKIVEQRDELEAARQLALDQQRRLEQAEAELAEAGRVREQLVACQAQLQGVAAQALAERAELARGLRAILTRLEPA